MSGLHESVDTLTELHAAAVAGRRAAERELAELRKRCGELGSVPASGVTRVSDASGQAASPPWMARGGGSLLRTRARLS